MADTRSTSPFSLFGRVFNSIREYREQRKEEHFLQSLPKEYAAFMERYVPDNPTNEAIFTKIKSILLKNPAFIKFYCEDFAKIGDSYLLQHLWKNTPINESDIRKSIILNPNCPKDIILDAIGDPFSEVAVNAILNPLVSETDCLEAVNRIDLSSPATVEALERKLEDFGYRVDWNPWITSEEDIGKPKLYKIFDSGTEVPLDNVISDANKRFEEQEKHYTQAPVKVFDSQDFFAR